MRYLNSQKFYAMAEILLPNRGVGIDFDRFAFRAQKEINLATLGRLKNATVIPEEVERCMFELIVFFNSAMPNGFTSQIASQSNDGVSVSYREHDPQSEIQEILYTYLADTDLMYRGAE